MICVRMKKIILILIVSTNIVMSNDLIVADLENGKAIEGVSFSCKEYGTTSNKFGHIDLDRLKQCDSIKINHISFREIKIARTDAINDTIFLEKKSYILPEIKLKNNKETIVNFSSMVKLDRLKIQENITTNISEILKKTIGITIQESQSGGGSPNFRGMEANRLLIINDGLPLNNAIYRNGHVQSSSSINPFFVEDINIVTGPAAVVYGDGAMGGAMVINTIAIKSKKENILKQQFETSSNSVSINYMGVNSFKKITYLNGLSINSYGNLKMGDKRSHGYLYWGNESVITNGVQQEKTAYDKYDLIQKVNFEINSNNSISLNTQFSTTSRINRFDKLNDNENEIAKYKQWYYGPQLRIAQNIKYTSKKKIFFSDLLLIQIAWQKIKESRHQQKNNENLKSNRQESVLIKDLNIDLKKKINKLNIHYGLSLRDQKVNSQANLQHNNGDINYNTTRYPDGGSNVLDISLFSQMHYTLNKKLEFYLGNRYNNNNLKSKFNDTTTYNLPFNEIVLENQGFVYSGGIKLILNRNVSFNTSIFSGFRNPNVDDVGKIFSKNDNFVIIPNDQLSAEKTLNSEIGFFVNFKKFIFKTQYYKTNITDAIQRNNSSLNGLDSLLYDGEIMQIQTNQNISSARISGLNIYSEIILNNKIKIENILNVCKGNDYLNNPLAHIPPLTISSNMKYIINEDILLLGWQYNGKKSVDEYDYAGIDNLDEATEDGVPKWNIFNIMYKKDLDNRTVVNFGIKNIFDIHYKTFGSGLSASGRNFIVSLTSKF
jgi:hemoglobin/transferrin/lactoferrin receptor protein|tara:strand:+ start:6852 stop:9173 length:2322 start_codon:yes stop_codon:yes gene_type:complete